MISLRLKTIADLVNYKNVIDVGADHGELERLLFPKVNYVKAIENKRGPFNTLKEAVKDLENVCPLYSDGLNEISPNEDVIVLAGMGGLLINEIISKKIDELGSVKQIIVDPHRDIDAVRKYLTSNGFKIDKEVIVKENNIYYFIVSFVKGSQSLKEDEILYGYKTNKDPLWTEYASYERERLTDLYNKSHKEELKIRLERLDEHEHD